MKRELVVFAVGLAALLAARSGVSAAKPAAPGDRAVWPNAASKANSDEWLVRHHDQIRQMRPRLLVLNFVNGLTAEAARGKVDRLIAALRESSRYHGYQDPQALPFLEYQVEKLANLTD